MAMICVHAVFAAGFHEADADDGKHAENYKADGNQHALGRGED
jgi:hypothetical protein